MNLDRGAIALFAIAIVVLTKSSQLFSADILPRAIHPLARGCD
ncbi:hypothetical protein [Coleofasciculus sp. E1-EBD-02]